MRHHDSDSFAFERPRNPFPVLGVSSFALTLVSAFSLFVTIAIAALLEAMWPGQLDDDCAEAVLLGLVLIGSVGLDVLGIGLGIAALCQPKRSQIFAWLGVGLGALVLFGVFALTMLAVVMD